jgi:hypothetical protein
MPLAHLLLLHRAACARHDVKIEGMTYVVRDMVAALRAAEEEAPE